MPIESNKKLKVIMVNYEFPPIGGGGGTTTRFLAKHLVKLGVDVSVLTVKPGKESYYVHPDGFKLYFVGPTKTKLQTTHIPELARFILTIIFYAKQIVKKVKPDLTHCFFTIPSGCFGLYCKKAFSIPFITSTLGADVPGFNIGDWRLNVYHFITHDLSRAIWNNSSYIVANSSSLKSLCKQFSQNLDFEMITNGVDTDIFYPLDKKNYSDNSNVKLLFISRLAWQKGIETLIKSLGILKNRGITNFKLTVVGDGHLKDAMFSLIDHYGIREKVDFLGWRKLEELPFIYRSSDLFILPSVMEGMPSVVLQAMACGLPVIVSKVDGFKEIVEENVNGFTAEYNNEEDFANAIEKLIKSSELREKMSIKSVEKSKAFSWESIAKKYLELYQKTVFGKIESNREKTFVTSSTT